MSNRSGDKLMNYTTGIAPIKTAGEIMGILAAKGAQSIMIDYERGEPVGLSFKIEVKGVSVGFRLPCNVEGAHKAMLRQRVPARYQNREQAARTAWRIIKSWVEAQMAIIECGQAEMAEVFLPYAIVGESGQTLFQRMQQDPSRLLADDVAEPDRSNVIDIEPRLIASGE